MATEYPHRIALLGLGTIGLSMLAMHLRRPDTSITVYDPRPDYESQIRSTLPSLLDSVVSTARIDDLIRTSRLKLATSLPEAIQNATIIQEQSPEVTSSKQALWKEVAGLADPNTHLWSSSSGIPASVQASGCEAADRVAERLLIAHPFNPPHLMPLVEIVPGPETSVDRVEFVKKYFGDIPGPQVSADAGGSGGVQGSKHYRPITLQKEIPGFVGNRLAFALLREACYLVGEGVVSARDLDSLVTASLGPRWAGSGVFESYHAGGGEGGIGAFLQKLSPTIQDVWGELGQIDIEGKQAWKELVVKQTEDAYGLYTPETRKKKEEMLREVVEMQKKKWGEL
ncbi:Dehydrogenase multihelical [Penicillium cf. griseofulvum]|uniref:L-gulonate 3-dehydrogenase n=1 Tax=Penicillium cf. griseofulvum TaxID=2972120 RepID=A0A9W9J1L6_9EURO|nr:Dehydrogenase multihelical [Penicillium cf. griseofulvum]KAJ5433997.1 Dehydrogenase multihelical [Penicillium cf. griseofulvum]KAJ5451826.1 Dehydrogenase multihelical [Penicillium cf. griseofulvum]